ncbi:MAG: septum formation protein Maf [Anaerolineae bacterium]|nr:septum formation protein Maf [Anaerolineae bacterium]
MVTVHATSGHRLLLASQSPRRRELLALLGLPFETAAPDVDEAPRAGEVPAALAARLSQAKAQACSNGHSIVIACDTIVAHEGQVLGKPRDKDEAVEMLRRLRGRSHSVYTAVTLLRKADNSILTDVAETLVIMRAYTDDELAAYVASGDPMDKAGAYAIQHPGFAPASDVQGCYANVMGLPLCHLTRCLCRWEVGPQQDVPTACQSHIDHCCTVYPSILNSK